MKINIAKLASLAIGKEILGRKVFFLWSSLKLPLSIIAQFSSNLTNDAENDSHLGPIYTW